MPFTPIAITDLERAGDTVTPAGPVEYTFTLTDTITDGSGERIAKGTTVVGWGDELGRLSLSATAYVLLELAATDDPTTQPTGVTWRLDCRVGGRQLPSLRFAVPHDAPGGTLDLATVAPALTGPAAYSYALDANVVHKIGAETVAGVKTFTSLPLLPGDPTTSLQAAAKQYVDAGDALKAPTDSLPVYIATNHGLACDQVTDDTAAFNALLALVSAAGGGSIYLPRLALINGQITMPTTDSATQRSQAPIRIFGSGPDRPGQARSAVKYPNVGGLDLRYAGRTDAGCATTLGSCLVTNTSAVAGDAGQMVRGAGLSPRTYILASTAGVGWTLNKKARATGSVPLTVHGGKIQGFGLGTLEIDHLLIIDQGTSLPPFFVMTGATLHLHDCAVIGNPSKSGNQCDQDLLLFGGPGQGTALMVALTSGNTYTSITVAPLPTGILAGQSGNLPTVLINEGGGTTQTVTLTGGHAAGDTVLACSSFVANANYPVRTGVGLTDWQTASDPTCLAVPAAPMQGYCSDVHDNYFNRVRSIYAGCWASDFSIRRNTWWVNCGSTHAAVPSTLTAGLTSGAPVTSLAVTALSRAVLAGDTIQVGTGGTALIAVASADAAVGATAIAVNSITPTRAYATGVVVFDPTAGLGAIIESYAIGHDANQIVAYDNRFELAGGYNYATLFSGPTYNGFLGFNNCQDANPSNISLHRFEASAQFNTIIPSIKANATVPLTDDVTGALTSQTTVVANQSIKSTFPQGIDAGSVSLTDLTFSGVAGNIVAATYVITTNAPTSTAAFTFKDSSGQTWLDLSQASGIFAFRGALSLVGNSAGAGTTQVTIGNGVTAADAIVIHNAPASNSNQIQMKRAGVNTWLFYDAGASGLWFMRDSANAKMHVTYTAGAGAGGGSTAFNCSVTVTGTFSQAQSAAAATVATGGTITTALTGAARVAPAAAVTGVILQAGTTAGQEVTVINESAAASSVTFDVAGTSRVADGAASPIPGLTARRFTWDSATSLWYRSA